MINIITWIMTAVSIIGTVMNSYQKRTGFYFWIIANVFWIIYNIYKGIYEQAVIYGFNTIMCIIGIKNWKKL